MNTTFPLSKLLFTLVISLLITGCNNDSNQSSAIVSQQAVQKYTKQTSLTGRVSNKKGNLRSGEVTATDINHKSLASTPVDKDGHYNLTLPANTELPIILSYIPVDPKEDKLISVAIFASFKKYDINDLTTVIAKKAKALGGYTRSNMSISADSTVGVPDANKTSTGFRGDPTKQYGGWH